MKRFRGGLIFVITLLCVLGLWFLVPFLYTRYFILPLKYPRLEPGSVNLLGVRLQGERIVVANGVAQLEVSESDSFGNPGAESGGTLGSGPGAKIPMSGLIGALRGEAEGVSQLIAALAKVDTAEIPDEEIVWDEAELRQALDGDDVLRKKLEYDLVSQLDGEPVERVNIERIRSGIFIRLTVPVDTPFSMGNRVIEGSVLVPYRSNLAKAVAASRLFSEEFSPSAATVEGLYLDAAEDARSSGGFEDVRGSLERLISDAGKTKYSRPVERLLARTTLLLNETLVKSAELIGGDDVEGKATWTMSLRLTTEGRNRLWQYTHLNPGCQLLLVHGGIAIAAPTVQHEMKYSTATITNISDDVDAQGAVTYLNQGR